MPPRRARADGGRATTGGSASQTLPAPHPGVFGAGPDHRSVAATEAPFSLTERAFQSQVVRLARLFGWACYHTRDSRRSEAGFPDLVMVRRPRVVWAELKSERGRLSPEQKAWIEELRASGQAVYIWRPSSWQEIERVLR
jgi:hypothetical protein